MPTAKHPRAPRDLSKLSFPTMYPGRHSILSYTLDGMTLWTFQSLKPLVRPGLRDVDRHSSSSRQSSLRVATETLW